MVHAIQTEEKLAREANIEKVKETAIEHFEAVLEENDEKAGLLKQVSQLVDNLEKDEVRRLITEEKVRPDGRKIDEIRPLSSEIDLLPRVHGSGLFTRGQTQALTSATLAPLGEYQVIDGLGIEEGKRFIHHYNFPQFSVGSVGRAGSPGRREIGHGALGGTCIETSDSKSRRLPLHNPSCIRSIRIKRFFFSSKYLCGNISIDGCWCAN